MYKSSSGDVPSSGLSQKAEELLNKISVKTELLIQLNSKYDEKIALIQSKQQKATTGTISQIGILEKELSNITQLLLSNDMKTIRYEGGSICRIKLKDSHKVLDKEKTIKLLKCSAKWKHCVRRKEEINITKIISDRMCEKNKLKFGIEVIKGGIKYAYKLTWLRTSTGLVIK